VNLPGFVATLDQNRLPWRETRHPGVRWLPLFYGPEVGGDASGDATVLIQMEPGSSYPAHRHRGVEEVLVLAGSYSDELGRHRTGDYVRYPAGSTHSPVAGGDAAQPAGAANPACLLFASARGGVESPAGD